MRRAAMTSKNSGENRVAGDRKTVVNRSKQRAAANGALMRLRPLNVGARGAIMRLRPRKG